VLGGILLRLVTIQPQSARPGVIFATVSLPDILAACARTVLALPYFVLFGGLPTNEENMDTWLGTHSDWRLGDVRLDKLAGSGGGSGRSFPKVSRFTALKWGPK
jgi:hypothetical protein